jgi:hypothetical protein
MHCWVGERSGLLGGRGLCCWRGRRGGGQWMHRYVREGGTDRWKRSGLLNSTTAVLLGWRE